MLAQGLRGKGTKIIGVLISDITEDFFARITKAIESRANGRGYSVILCDSEEDSTKESSSLEMLLRKGVEGIIFAPVDMYSTPQILNVCNVPLVQIDRKYKDFSADYVGIENASVAGELTSHLLGHGYRKLGFVGYELAIYTMEQRIAGFRSAVDKAGRGILASELFLASRSETKFDDIRAWIKEERDMEAVICGNANIANYVLAALQDLKVKIPENVAIVSFEDTPWYQFIESALTAVLQPTESIGLEAASLLFDRIDRKSIPNIRERLLPAQLIIRRSCGNHMEKGS
jgi:DNA-binding LacI/PurR family transcriptional regulator